MLGAGHRSHCGQGKIVAARLPPERAPASQSRSPTIFQVLLIIVGLALLVAGAELLVRGSVSIAARLGMSPLLIGLTLVSIGTSTPELVTTVQAALIGSAGIALGNVVGSNIANSLLIVGLAAAVAPISVHVNALRRDGVISMLAVIAFALIAAFLAFDRLAGAVLLLGLAGYLVLSYLSERRAYGEDGAGGEHGAALQMAEAGGLIGHAPMKYRAAMQIVVWLAMCVGGIALLAFGGQWLIEGASTLAADLGVSDTIIGLTIVAIGTSSPELVTSLLAALRRQGDVAFGNIIGSNIFNVLGIAGVAAIINPSQVPERIIGIDNPVMLAAQALLLVLALTGLRIARTEGLVLVAAYIGYVFIVWPR